MKNNGEFEIKVEGELENNVETQDMPSSDIHTSKSGGNAPSDLGAIKKNVLPNSGSNATSRSTMNRPISSAKNDSGQASNFANPSSGRQVNQGSNFGRKPNVSEKRKEKETLNQKKEILNPKHQNPILNQNRMKDFGKTKKAKDPKINSSASFFDKAKGLFNGKGIMSKLPGIGGFSSSTTRKKSSSSSVVEKLMKKKPGFSIVTIFQALPIQVKIAIVGGGVIFFLLMIVIVIVIITKASAADGNREMKDNYLKGDYTEAELCEYLERNDYLIGENGENLKCEDHPAYQFFVNFKDVMDDYETKYSRYRFQVNVELLYETLAYYYADEELYQRVTKDEVKNLIDAMLEEVEESCVVKTYDEKKKVCTEKKYVYTLYEFSLNKYISYLKYGTTSTHPNYGNDSSNTSSSGTAVTRICGEGKNTDYVFGYGLVNTSSSPFTEGSECPNNPVEESDYKDLKATKVTLEDLGLYGGVPYYSTINDGDTPSDTPSENDTVVGSGDGAEIAKYALQFVGNPYVWGGNSLTTGTDCSGFVKLVYDHFGISLSRTSQSQASYGKTVTCDETSLEAGDLIFYDSPISHVAIYIGDGKIVHAKGLKWGITTDKYNYSSKGINTCKRIVD